MKRTRFTLVAVLASLMLALAPRAAHAIEPIAHWEFDEGSGTAVHDSVGGFHGTQSHCGWSTSGVCNGSSSIPANGDGSGIVSGISAALDNSIGTAFTVTCWVRWSGKHTGNTYSPSSYVLDARDYSSGNERGGFILMILENGHVAFDVLNPRRRLESTRAVPVDDWVHVTAVFDAGTMKLYLNGVPAGSRSGSGSYTQTTLSAAIGNNRWAAPSGDNQHAPLNGMIDDLRLYAAALSPADIAQVVAQCLVHLELVTVGSGGLTVSGEFEPGSQLFVLGATASIDATADAGEWFVRWQGDGSGTAGTRTVQMTGNMRVVACFTGYGLSVGTEGSGEGTVGISYPADYPIGCTRFVPGDVARLTPSTHLGHFCAWDGDTATGTNPLDLPMTGHRSVSALFCPDTDWGLVAKAIGPGSIERSDEGPCYAKLTHPAVQLTAHRAPPWRFREWRGDAGVSVDTVTAVVMNGDKVVTARFGGYALQAWTNGAGTVTTDPVAAEYAPGSIVTLRAWPEPEVAFQYWVGDASGDTNPLPLVMDGDKRVSALFGAPLAAPEPAARLALLPATPNPFAGFATLRFELPRASRVTLAIHDVAGRTVRVALAGAVRSAGRHAWTWDGRDDDGNATRPGLYFARLVTDDGAMRGKLVRIE